MKNKYIYIILSYEVGEWRGCFSFGYFTNAKKCRDYAEKLNAQAGRTQFAVQPIPKNEL